MLTEDAALVMAEAALGLVPDLGGTRRLVELAGYAVALELSVTARAVPAAEALRLGLANQVVAGEELDSAVDRLVRSITNKKPDVVRSIKRLLADGLGRTEAEQLAAERRAQAPLLRGIANQR